MIEVEIIREYKCCWQVGQRREVSDEFAAVLIDGGFARRVERAHKAWRSGAWAGLKADAPGKVAGYTWDAVWATYWLPLLAQMEARLKDRPCS